MENTTPPELTPGPQTSAPTPEGGVPQAERQWAMFAHLSSLSGFIIPLGSIIGPLVMYLIKKDEFPFGSDQAKEALNFNISCLIYAIISAILVLVVIGIVGLIAVGILWLVCTIIAAIKANEGVAYRYPFTIRFVN